MRILYPTLVEDLKVRDCLGNLPIDRMMKLKSSIYVYVRME
jgi:hypothetical protein